MLAEASVARQVDRQSSLLGDRAPAAAPAVPPTFVPAAVKDFKVAPVYGGSCDFVEVDGVGPIEAVSADWSNRVKKKDGTLCSDAPVLFDFDNASGAAPWGPNAEGAIVVTIRGLAAFDEMAHNAAESGAVGLIIVDNEPK